MSVWIIVFCISCIVAVIGMILSFIGTIIGTLSKKVTGDNVALFGLCVMLASELMLVSAWIGLESADSICLYCGVYTDTSYCSECGVLVDTTLICDGCGAELEEDWKFCED